MAKKPKMTAAKFESTAKDKAMDKAAAKKAGMTTKAWEKSPADKKADTAAIRKINAKRKKA